MPGWRQNNHNFRKIKKLFRKAQKIKSSNSKDSIKKEKQEVIIVKAYQAYIDIVSSFVKRAEESVAVIRDQIIKISDLMKFDKYVLHAKRQIDQISRRVINKEIIPHDEKVFSIFEEHTEWISKGKAGVPVELGLKVCILEDQYGFILHHHVMQKQTDEKITVSMIEEAQKKFSDLKSCSFDKGFYSPANKQSLGKLLDLSVLPKKGRLSKNERRFEHSKEFVKFRHQHSAVESAINALEVHGLNRCPDHGIEGFKRYVSLGILARNIQQLGVILLKRKSKARKRAA